MNRNRFEERNRAFNIPQHERDRMYRVLQEQLMMEELMMEAARQAASSVSQSSGGAPAPAAAPTGLLITSADFVQGSVFNSGTATEIGTNGVDGFDITSAGSNQMDLGYIGYDLTTDLYDRITAAYVAAGIDPTDSQGYVWNATWGAGSTITTGLIKFGFENSIPASFYIQTIDPADPDWVNPGYDGTPLVGTFLFPLTINVYTPLIDKNAWC